MAKSKEYWKKCRRKVRSIRRNEKENVKKEEDGGEIKNECKKEDNEQEEITKRKCKKEERVKNKTK